MNTTILKEQNVYIIKLCGKYMSMTQEHKERLVKDLCAIGVKQKKAIVIGLI